MSKSFRTGKIVWRKLSERCTTKSIMPPDTKKTGRIRVTYSALFVNLCFGIAIRTYGVKPDVGCWLLAKTETLKKRHSSALLQNSRQLSVAGFW